MQTNNGKSEGKSRRTRADQLVVEHGFAPSREQARALILAGEISIDGRLVEKAGQMLSSDARLTIRERPRFVGRGGEKLEGALTAFALDTSGVVALDVGASTGGFTDCLLQRGATKVYSVDVGRAQLAERLRTDPRVVSRERTNARHPLDLPEQVDVAVIDVSFISLLLVLPETVSHVKQGGVVLALVKPQFEAGKERVGRKGVIMDPAVHADVVAKVARWIISRSDLRFLGVRRSVLEGDQGNREFFVLMSVSTPTDPSGGTSSR